MQSELDFTRRWRVAPTVLLVGALTGGVVFRIATSLGPSWVFYAISAGVLALIAIATLWTRSVLHGYCTERQRTDLAHRRVRVLTPSMTRLAESARVQIPDDDTTVVSETVRVDGHLVTISCRYLLDRNLWEPMALIRPAWDPNAKLEIVNEPEGCSHTIDDALDVATDVVVAWLRDQSGTALAASSHSFRRHPC